MGDSYSSGEGLAAQAGDYYPPTNTTNDTCHRDSLAYPELVAKALGYPTGNGSWFVACSGATTGDKTLASNKNETDFLNSPSKTLLGGVYDAQGAQVEKPQTHVLGTATKEISLTIGGNDMGFGKIAANCMQILIKLGPAEYHVVPHAKECSELIADSKSLLTGTAALGSDGSPLEKALVRTYETILTDAPNANLTVLTYPQVITTTPVSSKGFCYLSGGYSTAPLAPIVADFPGVGLPAAAVLEAATGYLGFDEGTQLNADALEAALNDAIRYAVKAVDGAPNYAGRIELTDVNPLSTKEALTCDASTDGSAGINEVKFAAGSGLTSLLEGDPSLGKWLASETFHPKASEHELMAKAVEASFKNLSAPPLTGVKQVVSDGDGYCAVLTTSAVDCWGVESNGELGNGVFNGNSAVPVRVVSTTGSGTLTGVMSLATDGIGYCALLESGSVDCWGYGGNGQLGDGSFYTSGNYGSAVPVRVVSTSGSGTLTGVAKLISSSLMSEYNDSYCAVLTSGSVDCWGYGYYGQLGNGKSYASGNNGSAVPVRVVSTSGSGSLTGVVSLANDGYNSYCALLTSGSLDCWGYGYDGELGDGVFYTSGNDGSAVPVRVVSTSGSGTLTGVASLTGLTDMDSEVFGGGSYCAVLTSGSVDCWGYGYWGELGDGVFYTRGNWGSALPVEVTSTSGSGTLTSVASLTSNGIDGYCALLTLGSVDCWGEDPAANTTSAVPVKVVSTSGSGTLTGVVSLMGSGTPGGLYVDCARLASGSVDCWGYGDNGQLGNGKFYTSGNYGSAVPVRVDSTSGSGTLTGVANLTSNGGDSYCALLTSGSVDCWGFGGDGQLGDGVFYQGPDDGSAFPVTVVAPSG